MPENSTPPTRRQTKWGLYSSCPAPQLITQPSNELKLPVLPPHPAFILLTDDNSFSSFLFNPLGKAH